MAIMQYVLQYALEVVLDHDVFDGKSLGSDIRKSPTEFQLKNDDDSHVVCVETGAEHLTRKSSTKSGRWRSLWECFTGSGCPMPKWVW